MTIRRVSNVETYTLNLYFRGSQKGLLTTHVNQTMGSDLQNKQSNKQFQLLVASTARPPHFKLAARLDTISVGRAVLVVILYVILFYFSISIIKAWPSIKLAVEGTSLFAGRRLEFTCMTSTSAITDLSVKWLMNGVEVKDGDMNKTIFLEEVKANFGNTIRTLDKNLSIQFVDLDIRHAGNFTCEVSDMFSTKTCNTSSTVLCKFHSLFA